MAGGFDYNNYGRNNKPRVQGVEPIYDVDNEQEDNRQSVKKQGPKIRDLVAEAAQKDTAIPDQTDMETAGYDPNAPLLNVVEDAVAMIYHAPTNRHRNLAIKSVEQNPVLLDHLISCAPNVVPPASKCKICKHTSRHCFIHNQAPQFCPPPSVSLCAHQRMVLTLAANDPGNRYCSWKLEIKDYTDRDPLYAEEHKMCKPHTPNQRVKVLVQRLMDDLHKHKMRGNERQAADEIHALLGAWEYSKLIQLEKIELAKHPQKLLAKRKREEMIIEFAINRAARQVNADQKALNRKLKAMGMADILDVSQTAYYNQIDPIHRLHVPAEIDAAAHRDPTETNKAGLQQIDDLIAERIRGMKAAGVQMTAVDRLGVKLDVLKELEAKKQGSSEGLKSAGSCETPVPASVSNDFAERPSSFTQHTSQAELCQQKKRAFSVLEEGEIPESHGARPPKKQRIETTPSESMAAEAKFIEDGAGVADREVELDSHTADPKRVHFTPETLGSPDFGRGRRGSTQIPGVPYKRLLSAGSIEIEPVSEDSEVSEEE